LRQSAGHWQLAVEASELTRNVPESLAAMIQRDVERLPAFQRSVLEAASAAGPEFSTAQVAAVLQADALSVEEVCLEWCRREQYVRLRELSDSAPQRSGVRCTFRHAMFQQVAYERTGATRRAQLHQRLGAWLEGMGSGSAAHTPELARHFELGGDAERAVRYLQAAGEHALQRSAHREAVGYLRRGFEQLRRLPESAERDQRELLLALALANGLAMIEGSAATESIALYQRARSLCHGERGTQAFPAVMAGLFLSHTVAGDHHRAQDVAEGVLTASLAAQSSDLELMARYMLGTSCHYLGELSRSRRELERARLLHDPERHGAHAHHQQEMGVGIHAQLSLTLWVAGYAEQALEAGKLALLQAQRLGHAFSQVFAQTFLAVLHQCRGEYAEVRRHSAAVVERAAEHGFRLFQGSASTLWGASDIRMGDVARGVALMKAGEQLYDETGSKIGANYKKALLASAYTEMGEVEQATREVTSAFVAMKESGERFWESELYRIQGELRLQAGSEQAQLFAGMPEPEFSAEQCFERAIAIAQQYEAKGLELRAAISLAQLWQAAGQPQRALELLSIIYDWFQEGFDTADLQRASTLIAELRASLPAKAAE
jgi:predicted ATPase